MALSVKLNVEINVYNPTKIINVILRKRYYDLITKIEGIQIDLERDSEEIVVIPDDLEINENNDKTLDVRVQIQGNYLNIF